MGKKLKSKKWSKNEIKMIEEYSELHAKHLKTNMYQNILIGTMRFSRKLGFFKNLSKITKRSITKCKSKFQKMERKIYLGILNVPEKDYNCYLWVRKTTRIDSSRKKHLKKKLTKNKKWNLRKKKWKKEEQVNGNLKNTSDRIFLNERDDNRFKKLRFELIKKYLNDELDLPDLTFSKLACISNSKIPKSKWTKWSKISRSISFLSIQKAST